VPPLLRRNLPHGITERELEDEFVRFGTLRNVWVARKPPGFGEPPSSTLQGDRLYDDSLVSVPCGKRGAATLLFELVARTNCVNPSFPLLNSSSSSQPQHLLPCWPYPRHRGHTSPHHLTTTPVFSTLGAHPYVAATLSHP
jgi:RNA recognition motif. (a.k.a. RRM, RBD, or RNP domain)